MSSSALLHGGMQPACALDAQHLGSAISATNWQQSLPLEGSAAGSFFVPSVAAVLPAEAHLAAAAGMAFPQWPPLMALGMGVGGSMDFHEQQHLYYRGTGYLRVVGVPPPPPTHTPANKFARWQPRLAVCLWNKAASQPCATSRAAHQHAC